MYLCIISQMYIILIEIVFFFSVLINDINHRCCQLIISLNNTARLYFITLIQIQNKIL